MPILSNIQLNKTNIFIDEIGNIILSANISHSDELYEGEYTYKIYINTIEVLSNVTIESLSINIPKSNFELGDNELKLIVLDDNLIESTPFIYTIVVENKTFEAAIRKYDFSSQFTHDLNKTSILLNNGATLKEGILGKDTIITTDNSNINTTGRKTIQNIVVNGNGDIVENIDIVENMVSVGAVGEGFLWEKEINLDLDINSINVI